MSAKHTPGPWHVGIQGTVVADSSEGIYLKGATEPEFVAFYGGNLVCESVADANAHLIAAAPDLFVALYNVLCARGVQDVLPKDLSDAALAAIDKATGGKP